METPSSMRMATTSQKTKKDETVARSALMDITNDSPIVGLAMEKIPPSSLSKNQVRVVKSTPGSGEALLRGQVKNLLQKVEEEAEFVNKVPLGNRPPFRVLLSLPGPSPVQILAPTPANTPQVLMGRVGQENCGRIAAIQVAEAVKPEDASLNPQECLINRALLFDSPEKLETVNDSSIISSLVSYPGTEEVSSSAWSLQVNVSVQDEKIEDLNEEDYEDAEEDYDGSFADLCEGLSKMSVNEFEGKHTRFVYNSDDELEREVVVGDKIVSEEVVAGDKIVSPSIVVLKGLPVPKGKHLRFHHEKESDEG